MEYSRSGDSVSKNVMDIATGYFTAEKAIDHVSSRTTAFKRVSEQLTQADLSTHTPTVAACTSAYLAKIIADLEWPTSFANGEAECRFDIALNE